MTELASVATVVLLAFGGLFFLAGTVGVLRFPDALSRLHALTKADNLGLGLIVMGLAVQADGPLTAAKLFLIWVLSLAASATTAFLIAGRAAHTAGEALETDGAATASGER